MNRAARRRAERAGTPSRAPQEIVLQNPVSEHFASFIIGNAGEWERMVAAHLEAVAPDACTAFIAECATLAIDERTARFRELAVAHGVSHLVQPDSATGQHLVLCGAGPSLAEHAAEWCPQGDQVWGCNSALNYLHAHGHKVTHGFTVDQTPHMVAEWRDPPPVDYLIASSVHPHLLEVLGTHQRSMTFFHNFVGINRPPVQWEDTDGVMQTTSYEDWLYSTLYGPTIRCGSGLNSVNRAIDLALCMGFAKITLLGADCAIRTKRAAPDVPANHPDHQKWLAEDTIMHADGSSAIDNGATALTMGGVIDGRHWETKVDMVISAVWLAKAQRQLRGRLRIIGDTLPNALMGKSEKFLARLPHMTDAAGKRIRIDLNSDPVYAFPGGRHADL